MSVYFWLFAIIVFGIIEAVTVGIVSVWFAFGALCALIAAALHAAPWLQITVFLATSAVALFATRPLIKKKILLNPTPTNADALIGEAGIVEEAISNLKAEGTVKIQGKLWSARSADNSDIAQGSVVKVLKIEGVKLIVELSQ
ncbi:MAG: NfeD family protein [Oscillospiraceae bacterium]|nr:NfeD family protein [Oscillospiraceae bacterium]